MNIWDWDCADRVEVVINDGRVFRGSVIYIEPKEEADNPEDTLCLETSEGIYGLKESIIREIRHY